MLRSAEIPRLTKKEIEDLRKRYFKAWPEVKRWFENVCTTQEQPGLGDKK